MRTKPWQGKRLISVRRARCRDRIISSWVLKPQDMTAGTQDTDQWRALVNTIMTLQLHKRQDIS